MNICIIGAGLGGLSAALALLQKGFRVTVLEQASALGEIGAGVQLGPNAVGVLYRLGLQTALEQVTCETFFTPREWEWMFFGTRYRGDHSFIFFE